ncbi:MAG: hypothetical protein ABL908_02890, partial [Hyphomicrobium sp.]
MSGRDEIIFGRQRNEIVVAYARRVIRFVDADNRFVAVAGSAGPLLRPWTKWALAATAAIVLVGVYWPARGSSSAVR